MNSSLSPLPATGPLGRLAERLSGDPGFMANVLAAYQAQERLSSSDLADRLGLAPEGLVQLALCKRPQPGGTEFAAQVRQIAAFVGLAPATLAQLIRQVDAMEAAKHPGQSTPAAATHSEPAPTVGQARLGWLAAARDRDETDEQPDQDAPDHEAGKADEG
ncbi:MAG: hypothetical protein IT318_04165 [Anaerolineales bacterium]|nr:hypothetical protein [Anaerolineales bacterium]